MTDKHIKKMDNYLNGIGKILLSINRLRTKDIPFDIRLALDEACIRTQKWYLKYESDLEEIKMTNLSTRFENVSKK